MKGMLLSQFSKVTEANITSFDTLILAAGADARVYQHLRMAASSRSKLKKVVVLDFFERRKSDAAYIKSYKEYQGFDIEQLVELDVSIHDTVDCIAELSKEIGSLGDSLAIDISGFTKPVFYHLISYLAYRGWTSLGVIYTQPRSYNLKRGYHRAYSSSSGPVTVGEMPSFPGQDDRDKERLLVLVVGFDGDLSLEINEIVAPTRIVVVNGFPSFEPKFKDISIICNERLVQSPNNDVVYSHSSSPFSMYNLLANLDGGDQAMTIAPLGNKPMALGACLYAIHNPKIRVVYSFPEKYANETTEGYSHTWLYQIPLSV